MRLKLIIGLWISLVILASCEERADYLNWSRKVANYCKYVKFSEESKRYECGPKLGEFYTYIIVHPDYDLPKNPIYPLVAYDGNDNVVMVGGNGRGQIWRMIKFEIWAFVRETKTGMKEVYYDEDEKAFIGLEMGDNKEDIKSKAWWSRDGGKSWVRAKVPLFKKKKSNSVVPVSPLIGEPLAKTSVVKPKATSPVANSVSPGVVMPEAVPPTPPGVVMPQAVPLPPTGVAVPQAVPPTPPGVVLVPQIPLQPAIMLVPKLPVGGIAEAVGGGYAVAIGQEGGRPAIWSSKATVPRNWQATLEKNIKNPHTKSLPGSLQRFFSKSSLSDLKKVLFDGKDFRIEDKDGDVWSSRDNGKSWEIGRFGGGSGTVGDPYEIENAAHLWLVREELNKHFKLMNDLDLSVIKDHGGFKPIGDGDNRFTGTFDGKGKVIRNLKIERYRNKIGFFGTVGAGGVVKNIGLENVYLMAREKFGGLVAWNEGTIEKSYVKGTVEVVWKLVGKKMVIGQVMGGFIGGLVGWNKGTIVKSYATSAVTGSRSDNVGGLVGRNEGTIEKSYATGAVTGKDQVGGLVGRNEGTIEESYATGDVKGKDQVGGIVGGNKGGTIKNSYATGNVKGAVEGYFHIGGLVGLNYEGGTIEKSYAIGNVWGSYDNRIGGLVGESHPKDGRIIGKNYWKQGLDIHQKGVGARDDFEYGENVLKAEEEGLKILDATETGWSSSIWHFQRWKYPKLAWQD